MIFCRGGTRVSDFLQRIQIYFFSFSGVGGWGEGARVSVFFLLRIQT